MGFWSFLGGLFRDASGTQPAPAPLAPPPENVASNANPPTPTPAVQLPLPVIEPKPIEPDFIVVTRPLTAHFETCYLIAYCDPASPLAKAMQADGLWYHYLANRSIAAREKYVGLSATPWTVGYGATGPDINHGTVWTQAQADADLTKRLIKIGLAVDRLVTVPLLPHEKGAMVDFAYNEGEGRLAESTMLKRLNDHNVGEAMAELMTFDIAGGRVTEGLEERRKAEKALFTTGKWQS
jgi:lysozyme